MPVNSFAVEFASCAAFPIASAAFSDCRVSAINPPADNRAASGPATRDRPLLKFPRNEDSAAAAWRGDTGYKPPITGAFTVGANGGATTHDGSVGLTSVAPVFF